jgi:hypothetical protein
MPAFRSCTALKDQKAYEAHAAAASTREFRDKLQALRNSPADDRFHNALSVGDLDGPGLLKALGDASRRDDVREFRDKLAPMSGALYDERLYETVN